MTGQFRGQDTRVRFVLTTRPDLSDPLANSEYRHIDAMSPRGKVTKQTLGSGVVETTVYDDSNGLMLSTKATFGDGDGAPPRVRSTTYTYDHFLNLKRQEKTFLERDATGQALLAPATEVKAFETYDYDDLQRLVTVTRGTVQAGVDVPDPTPVKYDYDVLGNMLSKSDYATNYEYCDPSLCVDAAGNAIGGPHAVHSVVRNNGGSVEFAYDVAGNMRVGDGRTIDYDAFNKPIRITEGSVITDFAYDPDGQRYEQLTAGKLVRYVGKLHEYIEGDSPETKDYLGPSVVVTNRGAERTVRYVHSDRLGSIDGVTDEAGNEVVADAQAFDSFGEPKKPDWQPSDAKLNEYGEAEATTTRGFTGHEHLDNHRLIHMNGRVYDPSLGRFLTVDPIVQNPANSQSLNPYSYILNNPLSGVDPTGYCAEQKDGSCLDVRKEMPTGSHIAKEVAVRDASIVKGGIVTTRVNSDGTVTTTVSGNGKMGPTQWSRTYSATETGTPSQIGRSDSSKTRSARSPFAVGDWDAFRRAVGPLPPHEPPTASMGGGPQFDPVLVWFREEVAAGRGEEAAQRLGWAGAAGTLGPGLVLLAPEIPGFACALAVRFPAFAPLLGFGQVLSGGGIRPDVIEDAHLMFRGGVFGDPRVTSAIAQTGTALTQWAKYTSGSMSSIWGNYQLHFYMNMVTSQILDFGTKIKFIP